MSNDLLMFLSDLLMFLSEKGTNGLVRNSPNTLQTFDTELGGPGLGYIIYR